MIEDWLLVKEEYAPGKQSAGFIDKSIHSFLKALSRIRDSGARSRRSSAVQPALMLTATLLHLVCISLTRGYAYVTALDLYILLCLARMERRERAAALAAGVVFPFLTLIALIPAMLYGSGAHSLLLVQKVFTTIMLLQVLSRSAGWNELSRALKWIRVPDLFIWTMDITLKYALLLGEASLNLLYALKLRSVGRSGSGARPLTGIIGVLFLKSYAMGSEMAEAMECRGFTGEYRLPSRRSWGKRDAAYLLLHGSLLVYFLAGLF